MLLLYICALAITAVATFIMSFVDPISIAAKPFFYIVCASFWLGIIGALCMAIRINRMRKSDKRFNKQIGCYRQLGVIRFFQNTEAIIADIAMIVSVAVLVICEIWIKNITLFFAGVAMLIFSFGIHCMLNGINYLYIKNNMRRG